MSSDPNLAEIARLDGELAAARAEIERLQAAVADHERRRGELASARIDLAQLRMAAPVVLVAWAFACDEASADELRSAVNDYVARRNTDDVARKAWLDAFHWLENLK